jgi:hypothetical protein
MYWYSHYNIQNVLISLYFSVQLYCFQVPKHELGKTEWLRPLLLSCHVQVTLRPTVSRPASLGVRPQSGTRDQFFFLFDIFFRHLWVCYFIAPSLTRGRVCNLLYNCFWALPGQSVLGQSPSELTTIFHCLIWDSPNLEGQVPVFISPRNRVAQLYPQALGSLFVASTRVCFDGVG